MADDKQKQEGTGSHTQIIVAVITVVGVLGAAIIANLDKIRPSSSTAPPSGTYKGSCSDVSVKGNILTANCRKADGINWEESSLDFKRCKFGIENEDGTLKCKKL